MQIEVKYDTNKYVTEYNLLVTTGHLFDSELVELTDDIENFITYYSAYQCIDNQLVLDTAKQEKLINEREKDIIRQQRKYQCFKKVDRSPMWYKSLTEEQQQELQSWYQAWLNAPDTGIIPETPIWLEE